MPSPGFGYYNLSYTTESAAIAEDESMAGRVEQILRFERLVRRHVLMLQYVPLANVLAR